MAPLTAETVSCGMSMKTLIVLSSGICAEPESFEALGIGARPGGFEAPGRGVGPGHFKVSAIGVRLRRFVISGGDTRPGNRSAIFCGCLDVAFCIVGLV